VINLTASVALLRGYGYQEVGPIRRLLGHWGHALEVDSGILFLSLLLPGHKVSSFDLIFFLTMMCCLKPLKL
jgi:hypothetical protein